MVTRVTVLANAQKPFLEFSLRNSSSKNPDLDYPRCNIYMHVLSNFLKDNKFGRVVFHVRKMLLA